MPGRSVGKGLFNTGIDLGPTRSEVRPSLGRTDNRLEESHAVGMNLKSRRWKWHCLIVHKLEACWQILWVLGSYLGCWCTPLPPSWLDLLSLFLSVPAILWPRSALFYFRCPPGMLSWPRPSSPNTHMAHPHLLQSSAQIWCSLWDNQDLPSTQLIFLLYCFL